VTRLLHGGLIRPARRPPGWLPAGPSPDPPPSGSAAWPGADEDLCYLAGHWRILQRIDGHRWSLDDLVTAWFAVRQTRAHPPGHVADLGCGIGAVLMLVAWCFPKARCIGVEAQEISVELARRSLAWNGIEGRCAVRAGDLRDPSILSEGPIFDLVTGTPPYLPPGTAIESRRIQRGPCHFERRGGIEAYCTAAARLMSRGGRFVTCAASIQAGRVARGADAAGLAIVDRLDVIPREGKLSLFSVYAMARATEGAVQLPAGTLVVRDRAGQRTLAFRKMRGEMGMPP
jgi:tRNA1Val (adenine37-N6)-methyltransferase